jgi:hypothetical protein
MPHILGGRSDESNRSSHKVSAVTQRSPPVRFGAVGYLPSREPKTRPVTR